MVFFLDQFISIWLADIDIRLDGKVCFKKWINNKENPIKNAQNWTSNQKEMKCFLNFD